MENIDDIQLSARDIETIMSSLAASPADEAAILHDKLAGNGGTDRPCREGNTVVGTLTIRRPEPSQAA